IAVRETIEHLFLFGEVDAFIWDYYDRATGILSSWIHIRHTMKEWWDAQVLMVEEKHNLSWRLIYYKQGDFHTTRPTTWLQMVIMLEIYSHVYLTKIVRGHPDPSFAAFCLRYHEGSLVGAKGLRISDSTNLVVEARAMNLLGIVKIINGVWKIPWSVTIEVNSININKKSYHSESTTIFKEGKHSC
ncbi:hypothetical protein H5410_037113, partial [Solanum commersonii]